MKNILIGLYVPSVMTSCTQKEQKITPVPFNQVMLTGGLWKDRMETEIKTTVPFSVDQSEPAIECFCRALAFLRGEPTDLPEAHRFVNSDPYKVMNYSSVAICIL
ncbi:hypothetical protein [Dysgonomonas termitidis]|uniref:Uncharacterized protein n=1 Tax=Dysgonomonas termitidis TaxID=1516126 RepID=A0ABV9L3P4_9BACT